MSTFTPPGRVERRGGNHPLFGRLSLTRGVSLLLEDGVYRQVQYPTAEELEAADAVYLGGRVYPVSFDEAVALTAAGYGAWVDYESDVFGLDAFGAGPFGGGA